MKLNALSEQVFYDRRSARSGDIRPAHKLPFANRCALLRLLFLLHPVGFVLHRLSNRILLILHLRVKRKQFLCRSLFFFLLLSCLLQFLLNLLCLQSLVFLLFISLSLHFNGPHHRLIFPLTYAPHHCRWQDNS